MSRRKRRPHRSALGAFTPQFVDFSLNNAPDREIDTCWVIVAILARLVSKLLPSSPRCVSIEAAPEDTTEGTSQAIRVGGTLTRRKGWN